MGLLVFIVLLVVFTLAIWLYLNHEKEKQLRHEEYLDWYEKSMSLPPDLVPPKNRIKLVKIREEVPSTRRISSSRVLYDEGDLGLDPVTDIVTDLAQRVILTNLIINNDSGGCDSPGYESNDSYSSGGESSFCGSDSSCGGGGCGGD